LNFLPSALFLQLPSFTFLNDGRKGEKEYIKEGRKDGRNQRWKDGREEGRKESKMEGRKESKMPYNTGRKEGMDKRSHSFFTSSFPAFRPALPSFLPSVRPSIFDSFLRFLLAVPSFL
jgi:hypothetical protein